MNLQAGLELSASGNASNSGRKTLTREKLCIDDVEGADVQADDADFSYLFRK